MQAKTISKMQDNISVYIEFKFDRFMTHTIRNLIIRNKYCFLFMRGAEDFNCNFWLTNM